MAIKKKSVTWRDHEDKSLCQMVEKKGKNWCFIAKELNKLYGYKKTGRQCRQRWYNELDPSILKSDWTEKEQDILFEQHRRVGNKWKNIAQKLDGRSDNSIKNHFYSTIRRSLRWINKHIKGTKDGTKKVRSIKPAILSKFFSISTEGQSINSEKLQQLRQVAYKMIDFSRKKINKNCDLELQDQQKINFLKFLQELYTFNQNTDYKGRSQRRAKLVRQSSDSDYEIGSYSLDGSYKIYPKRNQSEKKEEEPILNQIALAEIEKNENQIPEQKTFHVNAQNQDVKIDAPAILSSLTSPSIIPNIKIQERTQTRKTKIEQSDRDLTLLNNTFPNLDQNLAPILLASTHDTLNFPYTIQNSSNVIAMLLEQVVRLKQEVAQLKAQKNTQVSPIVFQGAIYVFPPSENYPTERINQFISYQTTLISGNQTK